MIISKKEQEQDMTAITYHYELTTADIDGDGDMRYTTYGVKALDPDQNIVAGYLDVSTDKALVGQLVERLNENQADVLHLEDILDDLLE